MKVMLSELKERRLVQIAVSYLVIGWGALSVMDQLADRGVVPELVYRIVLIWFLFGIPAALLIGWYHGEKGKQRAPLSEISLLLMLVVMASGLSVAAYSREQALQQFAMASENPLEMRRVAVRYFADLTDGEYQYLADGLTEDLIVELSQVHGLSVVSRNGSRQFRDPDVGADSIARALQAGTVVEGDVEQRGTRLRVHIRLVEGQSGQVFRRHSIDLGVDEALAARDSVAEATARLLREWLGDEVRVRVSAARTRSTAAWALLQRGEKAWNDAIPATRSGRTEEGAQLFAMADSLLEHAGRSDETWPDPHVSRAAMTYQQARLAQANPAEAVRLVEVAVGHADDALVRDNTNGRAYEWRGAANYYRFLLRFDPEARRDALLASAKADLLKAVAFDPLLASAHAQLSHLHFYEYDVASGVLAAQKAYETDMFLENVETVLLRLFMGTFGQGSFAKARSWCDEALRRFTNDYRLLQCELRLMVSPHVDAPDIDAAWAVVDRLQELAPPARKNHERLRSEILSAGVIARAARRQESTLLMDSARAVMQRAMAASTPETDPSRELLPYAAHSWLLIGDRDRAVQLLQQHAAVDPDFYKTQGEVSWTWRELETDPRFRAISGLR